MATKNTGPRGNTGPVSRPRHLVSEINATTLTAECLVCGPVDVYPDKREHKTFYACGNRVRQNKRAYRDAVANGTAESRIFHVLSEIDVTTREAICSTCGPTWVTRRRYGQTWICSFTRREYRNERAYRRHKQGQCAWCGFTGHDCQRQVNHVDSNHTNNALENLETLCANCHSLHSWFVQVGVPEELWQTLRVEWALRGP